MSKWTLYILLFLLMMIWGFNVSAIKILVTYFPPAFIQGVRVFLAGIIVIVYLMMIKNFKKTSRKNLIGIMIAGMFGVFGHHLCLALGLTSTTASNAGLILGLIPLSTSILAVIFLGERFTKMKMVGILLALAGVYLIVIGGANQFGGLVIGDVYIFGAVITQAISFVLIKKLSDNMDSRQMTGLMLVFGAAVMIVASYFIDPSMKIDVNVPKYVWVIFLLSSVIATGLGHMLYNYAIHRLGAGATSIFINLTPFFSLLGSVWLLGEIIRFEHIVGFVFIISGVILGTGAIESQWTKWRIRHNKPISNTKIAN